MVIEILQSALLVVDGVTIICNQHNESKRHKLQFFAEYTRRYQDIILRMPKDHNDPLWLNYMQLYFDLCSEEYYLRGKGIIDNDVWDLWVDGMEFAMRKLSFKRAWQGHLAQHYTDNNFIHFMNNLIRKGENKTTVQS